MSRQRQVARNRLRGDSWLRLAASCGYGKGQYGQEKRCSAFHSHMTQHGPRRFPDPGPKIAALLSTAMARGAAVP